MADQRSLAVPVEDPGDSEPQAEVPVARPFLSKRTALTLGGLAVALLVGLTCFRNRPCSKEFSLKDKVELDATGQYQMLSDKLRGVTSKSDAERVVQHAITSGSEKLMKKWEATKGQHAAPLRKLPNSFIPDGPNDTKGTDQGTAQCIFNVMEAMTAVVGLGDDINGMARVCRAPRGADSELACQVDGGIMVAWIGTIAAKLSLAASNCAETANIDAICAAGVTGIVAALGELAAAASLAAPTCSPNPPSLPTTKISELGDQTMSDHNVWETGRRLVIGLGTVGNGIQCGVDVSVVAENIANMGLAINQAVHSDNCDSKNWDGNKGLVRSLCTVDIGGAIAYFSQVVTFIQLAVLNCRDYLDIKALCGALIAGVATAAAAIAPYGSAIHAACALNKEAKGGRRLEELENLDHMDSYDKLNHMTKTLRSTMGVIGQEGAENDAMSVADLSELVGLAEPALETGASIRGASPFFQECQ